MSGLCLRNLILNVCIFRAEAVYISELLIGPEEMLNPDPRDDVLTLYSSVYC